MGAQVEVPSAVLKLCGQDTQESCMRPDDVLVVVPSPTGGTRYSPTFQECEDIVRSVLDAQVGFSL